ncbi:MAG: ABC-F family ATP-binding cassette domain-containing protein [Chloroflexota bacterium]
MLYAEQLSMSYGPRELFADVNFVIGDRERVGLVGPNGAGKSTLLRIIAGLEQAEFGRAGARGGELGYLRQQAGLTPDYTPVEELWKAFPDVVEISRQIEEVADRMTNGDGDIAELVDRQTELYEQYDAQDGPRIEARINKVLDGLGFTKEDRDKLCKDFSGGWQMRLELAKILVSQPDNALLDEPTNHLDSSARDWLANYLREYPGTILMVTHDSGFMDQVATRILDLENGKVTSYAGNYSKFVKEKEARLEALRKAKERQDREIAQQRRFIERFRSKATKASQVKSRELALEKMERIELPPKPPSVRFTLQAHGRTEQQVLTLKGIEKAFDDNLVLLGANLDVQRGHKVVLIGPNGTGKSTLLRIAAGLMDADAGEVKWAERARPGYYDQHQDEALDPERTVIEEVSQGTGNVGDGRVRSVLGQFLFSGDSIHRPISVLSGGERSRVALAKFLIQPTNVLLLDEPTNHLDRGTRDRLVEALKGYEGTIICASHDPLIVDGVATHVYEMKDGEAREILEKRNFHDMEGADRRPQSTRERRAATARR